MTARRSGLAAEEAVADGVILTRSHEGTKVFRGDFRRIFTRRCGDTEIFRIGNNLFSFSPFEASRLRVRFRQELGNVVVKEQVALRHVLAEVTLHHAGVDEVFEEAGGGAHFG